MDGRWVLMSRTAIVEYSCRGHTSLKTRPRRSPSGPLSTQHTLAIEARTKTPRLPVQVDPSHPVLTMMAMARTTLATQRTLSGK